MRLTEGTHQCNPQEGNAFISLTNFFRIMLYSSVITWYDIHISS